MITAHSQKSFAHYCDQHRSKFYRNEKPDKKGDLKVWYSHKIMDGSGFCVEKAERSEPRQLLLPNEREIAISNPQQNMFVCNAMNNAIALACNGKIEVSQIGLYYKRILSELTQAIQ